MLKNRVWKYLASERGRQQLSKALEAAQVAVTPSFSPPPAAPAEPRLLDRVRELVGGRGQSPIVERVRQLRAERSAR